MSDLYFKTSILLDGKTAPFTGEWVPVGRGRDNLFTFYTNGAGGIDLEYRSPFFDEGIQFHSIAMTSSGYADPTYSTSPMSEIRAICTGNGQFWAAVTTQN
jgi:hypothetical protein